MLDQKKQLEPTTVQLSVVVPAYGSPKSLRPLSERVSQVCRKLGINHQLIFVDDRCPQDSWSEITRISSQDASVIGIRLSRNFGQHAAIQAGLELAIGEWIAVMDCDLQDIPEEIPALLAKASSGYDIVQARRVHRNDAWHRRLMSKAFYKLLSFLTGTEQNSEIANFGIYNRRVIETIASWEEETKYLPAIVQWVGFNRASVEIAHDERYAGQSSYSYRKLFHLAVNVIIGFSDKPLKIVMAAGLVIAVLSIVLSCVIVILHLMGAIIVAGWASIVLSLWFLAGCLAFAVGLSGLYVGRILVEAKGRPSFIIDEYVGVTPADLSKTTVRTEG